MDTFPSFPHWNVRKTRWYPLSGIPWYVPYPLQSRAALLHTFFRHSGTLYFCSSPQTETTQGRFFPNIFCPHSLSSDFLFTDFSSAPKESISTRNVSFSKTYLIQSFSLSSKYRSRQLSKNIVDDKKHNCFRNHLRYEIQFYNSQLFTVLGNGITSRILDIPVRYMTQRSNPSPNPACLAEPYLRRSR